MNYETIKGGIRKHESWGWSEIYANFEDCFTQDELDDVIGRLQNIEVALSSNQKVTLAKLIQKRVSNAI